MAEPLIGMMSVPDRPQRIATKRDKSHHRAHTADGEIKGTRNKHAKVFSDALVGVVGFARDELHPIVGAPG